MINLFGLWFSKELKPILNQTIQSPSVDLKISSNGQFKRPTPIKQSRPQFVSLNTMDANEGQPQYLT